MTPYCKIGYMNISVAKKSKAELMSRWPVTNFL
jgi:hypothetical protein